MIYRKAQGRNSPLAIASSHGGHRRVSVCRKCDEHFPMGLAHVCGFCSCSHGRERSSPGLMLDHEAGVCSHCNNTGLVALKRDLIVLRDLVLEHDADQEIATMVYGNWYQLQRAMDWLLRRTTDETARALLDACHHRPDMNIPDLERHLAVEGLQGQFSDAQARYRDALARATGIPRDTLR